MPLGGNLLSERGREYKRHRAAAAWLIFSMRLYRKSVSPKRICDAAAFIFIPIPKSQKNFRVTPFSGEGLRRL